MMGCKGLAIFWVTGGWFLFLKYVFVSLVEQIVGGDVIEKEAEAF